MSTLKTNNVQVGQSITATQNFTLYQPTVPDGTVRLGVGNSGATTADVITANSAGNVGIGATSIPSGYKLLVGSSSTNAGIELFKTGSGAQGGYLNLRPSLSAGNEYNLSISAYDHSGDSNTDGLSLNAFDGVSFCTGSNTRQERARIDSSGNLLVGTTNSNPVAGRVNGLAIASSGFTTIRAANNMALGLSGSSGGHIAFYTDNGSTFVTAGNISSNGSTTSYNGTSDYRLKDNVRPLTNALARVAQLRPVQWTWKEGFGGTQPECEGFIAHELQEVVPVAVTGEKDAVNEDGNPVYQGIDTSFLVATLTAAIQELKAELDTVKAELAALKAV